MGINFVYIRLVYRFILLGWAHVIGINAYIATTIVTQGGIRKYRPTLKKYEQQQQQEPQLIPSINWLIVSIALENFRFEKYRIIYYLHHSYASSFYVTTFFFYFFFSSGSSEFVIIMNLKCRKISKQIDLSIVNIIWMEGTSYSSATFFLIVPIERRAVMIVRT